MDQHPEPGTARSRGYGRPGMIQIAAISLMLLAGAARAAEPDDNVLRGKAMAFVAAFLDSAGLPLGDNDTVTVDLVELNGESPREAFVMVKGRKWCGSRGCSAFVLDLSGLEAASVGDFIAFEFEALPGTMNGWRDIAINGSRRVYRDGAYRMP